MRIIRSPLAASNPRILPGLSRLFAAIASDTTLLPAEARPIQIW